MNVFIIPSWYPSETEPHTGIFFKEQAEAMAHIFPASNFAISTWGSHDSDLLLHAKDHFQNLLKIKRATSIKAQQTQLKLNLTEYYTPAFTWTRKLFQGNIRNIIKANEKHLLAFQTIVGKVNVIHAHSAHPAGWVAMELAKKYNIPYVITEHMGPFPFNAFKLKSGKLSPWLEKPLHSSFANIAVSPQQKATLQQWGIPRVNYIPNLVNESFFVPATEPINRVDKFTFFTLARLVDGKGIAYLLQAFKLLVQTQPVSRLRIGGVGPEMEKYKALAAELSITAKVEWLGVLNHQEALKEYQHCDAFVLPSLHENLPLVLLEAMACGMPLISTYCGGPESIITPETGLLVEPANKEALSKAMAEMQNNYQKYNQAKIREEFCNRYSRAVVCRQIMEVYKSVSIDKE